MLIARIGSKGQITIPKKVRDKLGLNPGDIIGFIEKNRNIYIEKSAIKSPFDKWVGRLKTIKGKTSNAIIKELRGI